MSTLAVLPTVDGFVHGIVGVAPFRIQCDGCGQVVEHDGAGTVARFVMLCGIEFVGGVRLCTGCRA